MSIASKARVRSRRVTSLAVEMMEVRSLLSSTAVINWTIAPQIARDPAHGNEPDLPNTSAYVNPPEGYDVRLDASKTTGITPKSTFIWTITPTTGSPIVVAGEKPSVDLQEGTYTVHLEADSLSGTTGPVVADSTVTVKDILIVSIGASYASGEGDPVVPGYYKLRAPQWAYSPDPSMETENADAHRSTISGAAQFALQLQEANPQEAVTFVSVAASGATIDNGLLGPMPSIGDVDDILEPQLAEVAEIVGSHPIDVLTVEVGADDIGVSSLFHQLAANTQSGSPTLASIQSQVDSSLAALPSQFAALGQAIQALHPANVLATDYPDPTKNAQGDYAPILSEGKVLLGTTQDQFFSQQIDQPLNQAIATAAGANGWTYVSGLSADFQTHGYPSTDPWINSFDASERAEGVSFGGLHPNAAGQLDIARRYLSTYEQIENTTPGVVHAQGTRQRSHHDHRRA